MQCPYLPYFGAVLSQGVCCNNFVTDVFQVAQRYHGVAIKNVRNRTSVDIACWLYIRLLTSLSSGSQSMITWPLELITWFTMARTVKYGMVLFTITKYSSQNGKSRFQWFEDLSRTGCGRDYCLSVSMISAHHERQQPRFQAFSSPEPTIILTCGRDE